MLNRLTSKRRRGEFPGYSRLRLIPTRGLPPDLVEQEAGDSFSTRRDALERELLEPPRRPPDDKPLFTELLAVKENGLVTITLPDSGAKCLPVFSTPFRAADYVRTLLPSGPSVQYLSSSPAQLFGMLRDLARAGIETFALDRCPRCSIFAATGFKPTSDVGDLLAVWSISKATELARADLYFAYALASARAGNHELARDVALETVGHVALEDPRPHLLLGQLAVRLEDRGLLREAKAFLRFFELDQWESKLERVAGCGFGTD